MKNRNYGRRNFFASIAGTALVSLLIFTACEKEESNSNPRSSKYTLSGSASGSQEVPAVTTNATATLTGSYDTVSKSLIYSISWSGLSGSATMAHFHGPALAGESAGVLEPLTISITDSASGTAKDTITASAVLHAALMAGKVYYNIHTVAHPDGEIRGQVNVAQ